MRITQFQVNGSAAAAVTDSADLRCALCTEGAVQEMSFFLYCGGKLCWESGTMPRQSYFTLKNLPLEPCCKYQMAAEVSGDSGSACCELILHTGLMGGSWQGRWIEPKQEPGIKEREIQFFEQFVPMPDHFGGHDRLRPVQELQRAFNVEKLPEQAVLCASAHGVYAITTAALLEVLEALAEPTEKIARYRLLLKNIRKAVCDAFIHEDGSIEGDLQGLYVMALRSGVAEPELAQKVADRLEAMIEANNGGLDTGFVSTPHLLDMLAAYGHEDRAWKLLFRTESPGWLYQVEQGATTIWENWNAIRPDGTVTTSSYNHYSLGAVGSWIYRHIGGLYNMGAGWNDIRFAPDINCGLEWAVCSHQTPHGLAACKWEKKEGQTSVEITVPCGVHAVVSLPGLERELTAGTHSFTI